MPRTILDTGYLNVSIRYLHRKPQTGMLYYHRRIPSDLVSHYGHMWRRKSLKTRDEGIAARKIAELAERDDAEWETLRSPEGKAENTTAATTRKRARALMGALGLSEGEGHLTGQTHDARERVSQAVERLDDHFSMRYPHWQRVRNNEIHHLQPEDFYTPIEAEMVRLVMDDPSTSRVLLSDALEHYLTNHSQGQQTKFVRDNRAYVAAVINTVGDLPVSEYRRPHANAVRDAILKKGRATGTVRRALNQVSAIVTHAIKEMDLQDTANPFAGVRIANEGHDAAKKVPFTLDELHTIAAACKEKDDDVRHIVAIQADIGCRIGDVVGLRIEDLFLDEAVPHVWFRFHRKLGRTLKNANTERKVPLVGMSLWGAHQALQRRNGLKQGWLFPRYAADHDIRATPASNMINKWLRTTAEANKTSHCFRHAMRDRLRHAEAPEELQDVIGGWSANSTVGRGYGQGYSLKQIEDWLLKIVLT